MQHFGMTKASFNMNKNLICETCSYKRLAIKTTSVSAESNFGLHCLNRYSLFIKLEMFPNIPLLVLLGKGYLHISTLYGVISTRTNVRLVVASFVVVEYQGR